MDPNHFLFGLWREHSSELSAQSSEVRMSKKGADREWQAVATALTELREETRAQRGLLTLALDAARARQDRGGAALSAEGDAEIARTEWNKALAQISAATTKCTLSALLCSYVFLLALSSLTSCPVSIMAKAPTSAADAVPFVEMMQNALPPAPVTLLALLDALHASVGLSRAVSSALGALLDALEALSEGLLERHYAGERIAQLTGVVWRTVEALQRAPLTEREAAQAAWKEHVDTATDAHRELKEAIAEAETNDQEEDEDEDEDEDFGGRVLRRDVERLRPCAELLKLSAFALKQVSLVLPAPKLWSSLESLSALTELCDDLVAACYTPVDSSALRASWRSLSDATVALLSSASSDSALSEGQRLVVSGVLVKVRAVSEPSAL